MNATSVNEILIALMDRPELLPEVSKRIALGGTTLKLLPFTLTFPRTVLRIDWWRDEVTLPEKGSSETCVKSSLKTCAGNQSPQQIAYDQLLPALRIVMKASSGGWFSSRMPLSGRFGFDHTAAVEAIDAGWSPDKLQLAVATSPAVELLAMIGLQRFRPAASRGHCEYAYSTWCSPATAVIAALKTSYVISDAEATRFTFRIGSRGNYRYFGAATPMESMQ